MSLINSFLILCIKTFRPFLLGPAICLFSPSCSQFACNQLQEKPFFLALVASIKRIISCNSFTR